MLTKGDKSTDSEGTSLTGVLEIFQKQNRAMLEQHKAQQKKLLYLIEQPFKGYHALGSKSCQTINFGT